MRKRFARQSANSYAARAVRVIGPREVPESLGGSRSVPAEFGAKISVSKVGRFAFLDRLSWDSYNGTADLKPVVEHYRKHYGCYPESLHVDAIYRTRENRRYCGERGFSLARVMAKRADTSESAIAIAFLVMNLETLLQILFRLLARLWRTAMSVCKSLLAELRTDFVSIG